MARNPVNKKRASNSVRGITTKLQLTADEQFTFRNILQELNCGVSTYMTGLARAIIKQRKETEAQYGPAAPKIDPKFRIEQAEPGNGNGELPSTKPLEEFMHRATRGTTGNLQF